MKPFALGFLLLVAIGAHAGKVYKHVDGDGNTYYSDVPTRVDSKIFDLPKRPLSKPGANNTAQKRLQYRRKLLDAWAKERQDQKDKAARRMALKQKYQSNCSGAQKQLSVLKDGGRIYQQDTTTGARHYITERERQTMLKEAATLAKQWCGPIPDD